MKMKQEINEKMKIHKVSAAGHIVFELGEFKDKVNKEMKMTNQCWVKPKSNNQSSFHRQGDRWVINMMTGASAYHVVLSTTQ